MNRQKKVAIWVYDISVLGGLERVTWTLYKKLQGEYFPDIKLITTSNKYDFKLDGNCIVLEAKKKCHLSKQVKKILIEYSISTLIIEVSDLKTANLVATAAKSIDVKVISTLHNTPYMYLNNFATAEYCFYNPKFILKKVYKKSIGKIINYYRLLSICKGTQVVTVGDFCRRELLQCFSKYNIRAQTIYNLIDLKYGPEKVGKTKKVLFIGRFSMQKNLPFLLNIWKEANVLLPDYTLQLVGDGEDRSFIKRIIQRKKIQNIQMLPKSDNVIEFYRNADVCILTSFYEGLPTVFLEAISQNCPIFSTKGHGGNGELMTITGNGCYVDFADCKQVAIRLKEYLDSIVFPYKSNKLPEQFSEGYILSRWKNLVD